MELILVKKDFKMKKMLLKLSAFALMSSTTAMAFAEGAAVEQIEYATTFGQALINFMLVILFFGSLIIIMGAAFMFFKDYVMAKDDREKKFSVPQLFAGMLVASILAAPTGFFVISNDLLTGKSGVEAPEDVFSEREVGASSGG
jgi:hypothetical protein